MINQTDNLPHWISEIDRIITEIPLTESPQNRKELMDGLGQGIYKVLKKESLSKGFEGIFDVELRPNEKKFIAACLFRIMVKDGEKNNKAKNEHYMKTISLFDETFVNDLYKISKVEIKDQTYIKENKMIDSLLKVQSEWTIMIDSIDSPLQFLSIRQELMQKLNSKVTKAIIQPFMPMALESRLNSIFNAVKEYTEAKEFKAIVNYKTAMSTINEFSEDIQTYSTEYSKIFLQDMLTRAIEVINKDFLMSPAGKAGEINIKTTEKKYPLYIVGEKFDFSVLIENIGSGYALDVVYNVEEVTDNISVLKKTEVIGTVEPGSILLQIPCEVKMPDQIFLLRLSIAWNNSDGTKYKKDFEIGANSQRSDINWDILRGFNPYSLEPVFLPTDLIGRIDILQQLEEKAVAKSVGSSFVYGQKRVGKTSVARVLEEQIKKHNNSDHLVIYLESGSYIDPVAERTVSNLGKKICKEIINTHTKFKHIVIPDFDGGSFSPLTDFLDSVLNTAPNTKILFILDEFDEINTELFKGDIGKALFLTIRTISNREPFGFVLVGGEKMEFVINYVGGYLNKFEAFRIDYFKRETQWQDFEDLIRRPVSSFFEYTNEAIRRLYEITSGNPFFTKMICRDLYSLMVERRDAHVTLQEVDKAVDISLDKAKGNSFSHFWDDGILEDGVAREDISIRRRKVLMGFATIARKNAAIEKAMILDEVCALGLSEHIVEAELREFIRRQVLLEEKTGYSCKALFFQEWLKRNGFNEIITTFTSNDELADAKRIDEEAAIKPQEILELTQKWMAYQGKSITGDNIRAWLNQFGNNKHQRLMFRLLQQLRYYDNGVLRQKMKEAHGIVKRGIVHEIKEGKKKREDILVSYLDGPGKSGSYFAKLYVDENQIYVRNIIEKSKLSDTLKLIQADPQKEVKAIVFIDDIIGSGDTVINNMKDLREAIVDCSEELKLYFVAVCGFSHAIAKVEKEVENLAINIEIHVCDILDQGDRCFSDESRIYPLQSERIEARKIACDIGNQIEKKTPLGHGDVQANVVFEYNCPNNSLPILYKTGKGWNALFPRQ